MSILFVIIALSLVSCTSITRSAASGDIAGVKKYLDEGVNINSADKWGWSPIMWAIYYNQYDLVKWLLERGADPNIRSQKDYGTVLKDSTPLILAAQYGYGGLVRMLINAKGDLKAKDRAGDSVETIAEKNNYLDIMMLVRGGKKNTPDAAVIEKAYDKKEEESEEGSQVFFLNTGEKLVGKIVSQNKDTVTIRSKGKTTTLDKNTLIRTSIPYQQY